MIAYRAEIRKMEIRMRGAKAPYDEAKGEMRMLHSRRMIGKSGIGSTALHGWLAGLLAALAVELTALSVTALLIAKGVVGEARAGAAAKGLYTVALCLGCFLSALRAGSGKLLWAGLTALLVFGLNLLACAGVGVGPLRIGAMLWLTVGALLVGGLLGAKRRRSSFE